MDSRTMLILPIFRDDIDEVISWSEEHFGQAAAERYSTLIEQGMIDLIADPVRGGSRVLVEAGPDICIYHLKFSRYGVDGERVKQPRHIILYRHSSDAVEFARLLHESRELDRHLPDQYRVV